MNGLDRHPRRRPRRGETISAFFSPPSRHPSPCQGIVLLQTIHVGGATMRSIRVRALMTFATATAMVCLMPRHVAAQQRHPWAEGVYTGASTARSPQMRSVGTAFVGITASTPRKMLGGAWGGCADFGCYELELTHTYADAATGAPSIWTFGGNYLVQFRSPAPRMKLYGLAGYGVYDETGGRATSNGAAMSRNLGGGARIAIGGPLTVRLEYRLVLLGRPEDGEPVASRLRRVSAGLSLSM